MTERLGLTKEDDLTSPPGVKDRYELVDCLGRGASGTVYACRDRYLANSLIAMKVFPAQMLQDPAARTRLAGEIRACNRVDHENVVCFYDFIQENDFFAMTMEYVAGIALRRVIRPDNSLPIARIVAILRQMCSGLGAIHEADIIHRDLKPDNVLISPSGTIKITDFGIATFSRIEDKQGEIIKDAAWRSTAVKKRGGIRGRIVGTLEYISPEFIEHNTFDSRSDIYSLGVIAYELITGRYIFDYENLPQLLQAKVTKSPKAPQLLRPDCPIELSRICMKALRRDPRGRYQNVQQIQQDLARLAETLPASADCSDLQAIFGMQESKEKEEEPKSVLLSRGALKSTKKEVEEAEEEENQILRTSFGSRGRIGNKPRKVEVNNAALWLIRLMLPLLFGVAMAIVAQFVH